MWEVGAVGKRRKFYDKETVIRMIKEIHSSGGSLSCTKVDSLLVTSAIHHFGKWSEAIRESGIEYKHAGTGNKGRKGKYVYTNATIKEILLNYTKEGKTATDLYKENRPIYNAIVRRFGGVFKACEHFGITPPTKRKPKPKRTKEELDNYIKELGGRGKPLSSTKVAHWAKSAARKYYGGWTNALKANGFKPVCDKKKRAYTKEEVIEMFKRDHDDPRKYNAYRKAINKYFGSVQALREELGLFREAEKEEFIPMAIDEIDDVVMNLYNDPNVPRIDTQTLEEAKPGIVKSIKHHFGTLHDYFNQLDIDYYKKPVPFYWNEETLKKQFMLWYKQGKPLNYTYLAPHHEGFICGARKYFGGYRNLVEACGVSYDEIRIDTDLASYYGYIFEDIVDEVLKEIGLDCERHVVFEGAHPDFVCENRRHWIDAKLSQWTGRWENSDAIDKYEDKCDKLTIVFLRGDLINKKVSDKTTMVNIRLLVEQIKDENKRKSIINKLDEIEKVLDDKNL